MVSTIVEVKLIVHVSMIIEVKLIVYVNYAAQILVMYTEHANSEMNPFKLLHYQKLENEGTPQPLYNTFFGVHSINRVS